jgi:hypothetical protein
MLLCSLLSDAQNYHGRIIVVKFLSWNLEQGFYKMGEEAESVNSIGNKPEDVGGIEQHEPLVVSSSRARNGTNPSDTSPITLFQVNNLIQDESRARMSDIEDLVAQLRLEFKDII